MRACHLLTDVIVSDNNLPIVSFKYKWLKNIPSKLSPQYLIILKQWAKGIIQTSKWAPEQSVDGESTLLNKFPLA